ncbi:E3 ubiquitin-protein ligase bre1 [Frankliniella fusca]|uniref:E3 ubiquitin-protein ligase bre1 n=1 Tax=Frankliniella fusca TaxID=407009 RepID=A0AAE1GZP0_9NEOP|nr:E3 ubiquitin-protein ligase bre1 [Frankliniella fusca]
MAGKGTPGNPAIMLFVSFAMLVALTEAARMQDSEPSKGERAGSIGERTRRTMRGCADARGELRPELQHPYSADEVDGIVKHIKMRLSDLRTPKKPYDMVGKSSKKGRQN